MADAMGRNPIAAYADQQQFEKEREHLFGGYPELVGFSCQIRETGDYFVDNAGGRSVLVVRGADGRARAFLNYCRHRGARIVSGCGSAKTFACPYHGWSYDAEGRLVGLPDAQGFPNIERGDYGLVPLPIAERHGMVWIRREPGADFDIDAYLGELGDELALYDLASYHFWASRPLAYKMNWKIALDTFGESYHFKTLHPKTVGPILHHNLSFFEPFGPHHRKTFVRKTVDELRGKPESEWDLITHAATVYILFPNVALTIQNDHVDVFRIYPGASVGECTMQMDFYIPEPARTQSAERHWNNNVDLLLATVETEDFPTGESIQEGIRPGVQQDYLYGRFEPALAHFHEQVRRAIGME